MRYLYVSLGKKNQMKVENRGGARKGAGAKKKEPSTVICFRVKLKGSKTLKKKIQEFIKNQKKAEI